MAAVNTESPASGKSPNQFVFEDALGAGEMAARVLSQTFTIANFTDGGGTSGFVDFGRVLPAGALVLGWQAVTSVAFAGDTTATAQVGFSGTVGAYSTTTTGSVFTAGTIGSATTLASAFTAATKVPRVTITSSTDFTLIVTAAGGTVTVSIYYLGTI